jgi:intein/homing endonuclease
VILEDRSLHDLATSDVFWDEVAEITSLGEQDVFDASVPGTNNFIAQGIAVSTDASIQPTHAIPTKPETAVPK